MNIQNRGRDYVFEMRVVEVEINCSGWYVLQQQCRCSKYYANKVRVGRCTNMRVTVFMLI